MGRLDLSRIRKKYNYSSGDYQRLIQRIVANNTVNMQNKAERISLSRLRDINKRLPKTEKNFIVPKDIQFPRDIQAKKAVERGDLISKELHDRIGLELRRKLAEFTPKTGEGTYVRRRGSQAGTINPRLISEFEDSLNKTFESYTKTDSRYGMPTNVHAIAVTEFRSAVNEYKSVYMERFIAANPDTRITKVWQHNKSLSREPRENHMRLNGVRKAWDESFDMGNGIRMRHPHDPQGPPGEIINCNCDYLIVARRG
jgi:hypothetical protein